MKWQLLLLGGHKNSYKLFQAGVKGPLSLSRGTWQVSAGRCGEVRQVLYVAVAQGLALENLLSDVFSLILSWTSLLCTLIRSLWQGHYDLVARIP